MSSSRVLILLKSYLGDAVMVTPLLRAMAGEATTVRAPAIVHELLKDPDRTYRPMVAEKFRGLPKLIEEARRLRKERFDAALLVNRSFRMALLTKLAKIPVRIGHATEGRSWLLTETVPYSEAGQESRSYADLAAPLGVTATDLTTKLWVSDDERAAGKERLGEATIGIQPGARYPSKTIPRAVLVEVAQRLLGQGIQPVLLGGADEREAVAGFNSSCMNLVGELGLRESMGVAAGLKALIGGDTGFMHVAAAVGCPTITVFGPTPSAKWGHLDPPHEVIQIPGGDVSTVTTDEIWSRLTKFL